MTIFMGVFLKWKTNRDDRACHRNAAHDIRAVIKALHAGLSQGDVVAEADRELERWRKSVVPQEADEPAAQAQPLAPAVSGLRKPNPGAPNPHIRGPRLRVL
jgi:hypothetical protein